MLRRQPLVFWALVALALGTGWWGTHVATRQIADGAATYGSLVEVVVTTADVEPGERVGDSVRVALVPSDLVPHDALSVVPPGAVARERLVEGEAVAASRLAPDGARGIEALLGPGERAVAIPLDGHRVDAGQGHRVDVLSTTDPALAGPTGATTVVVRGARVIDVDDDGIVVAVAADDALDLATAQASAVVTVVVVGA